jgi:drug/metabolite transporter (DMT)-like permease
MTTSSANFACYAAAVGAGLATAGVSLCLKAAERHECRPRAYGLAQLGIATLLSLAVAVAQGANWTGGWFWVLGLAAGALMYGAIPIMIAANRVSPPSLVWAMANMGLLLPILGSAVFLDEPLRPLDAIVLALFAGLLALFQRGTRAAQDTRPGSRAKVVLLLAAVLAVNGLLMFGFKINGMLFPEHASGRLSAVMYGTAALLALIQFRGWRELREIRSGEWRWGSAAGLASGTSILLLLPTMRLPASVAFPIIQGASLLSGCLLTALVFRERLNKWKLAGILLGLAVLILAVLR